MLCTIVLPLSACSSLRLKAKDGTVVYARTMDFPHDLHSEIIFYPRNIEFHGTLPGNKAGYCWKNKYGIIGINGFNVDVVADGMNEKGLVCGIFYFDKYAEYEALTEENASNSIAQWELATFLLGTCATVQEVRDILPSIRVVFSYLETLSGMPLHYVVHDAQGKSLVVEYVKGKLTMYDNSFGVFTNSPSFDWHLLNISNYLHLFTLPTASVALNDIQLFSPGQGSNLVGLPGDFMSPSRFLRLIVFSQLSPQSANVEECIGQIINIMDSVNVPRGPVVSVADGTKRYDYTQWRTVHDLTHRRMYYRTYGNHNYYFIDLNKLSFDSGKKKKIIMKEPVIYIDNTRKFQ